MTTNHTEPVNLPDDSLLSTGGPQLRVGVLEDERHVREIICRFLRAQHMEPHPYATGAPACQAALSGQLDLMLVDLGLGNEDGIDIIRRIRASSPMPMIIVSGRAEISMVSAGLDAGADDYVRKPIAFEELGARIRSVMRRKPVEATQSPSMRELKIGMITVDLSSREAIGPEGSCALTERELLILAQLARQPGRPVSRDSMCRSLLGHDWDPTNRILDVHISNIRSKLEQIGAPKWVIRTRRNAGYEIRVDDE